jgi:hypothetical protein
VSARNEEREGASEPEFGAGFVYCLGLFLSHEHIMDSERESPEPACAGSPRRWLSGASDHLLDLRLPQGLPPELVERVLLLVDRCLDLGKRRQFRGQATWAGVDWACAEVKEVLQLVDGHIGASVCHQLGLLVSCEHAVDRYLEPQPPARAWFVRALPSLAGASVPEGFPQVLADGVRQLAAWSDGLGASAAWADVDYACNVAKELLRQVDELELGVRTVLGHPE